MKKIIGICFIILGLVSCAPPKGVNMLAVKNKDTSDKLTIIYNSNKDNLSSVVDISAGNAVSLDIPVSSSKRQIPFAYGRSDVCSLLSTVTVQLQWFDVNGNHLYTLLLPANTLYIYGIGVQQFGFHPGLDSSLSGYIVVQMLFGSEESGVLKIRGRFTQPIHHDV
jgi:hypothetical protein